MSEEFVSQVLLEINGQSITDFKAVEEKEFDLHKPVNLMNGTGHITAQPRHGVNVDYVLPKDAPEFDFTQVKGGTITIDYQNGTRIKYGGVYVTKIGAVKHDGENESTRTIEFSAKTRK
ncbi:hypothetical protein ASZ90_005604 [hydrocarbon metagenome]|uniref:Uncharacterized protein n=1 Tax=hydrocarbon metagenome TaxID=938273 RepID=A0A0W8FV46_9ZZZZ